MAGTHYEVLGVGPNASPVEVRKAFVDAARRHHPDRHATADAATRREAERRMREVNEAWAVLGDVDRRRDYDRRLGLGLGLGSAPSTGPSPAAGGNRGASGPTVPGRAAPSPPPPPRDWRAYASPGAGAATKRPVGEQLLMLSPMLLLVAAGAFGLAASLVHWPPFYGAAMISLICAAAAFFMLPIWAMSRSNQRRGTRSARGAQRSRRRQSYVASRRAAMAKEKLPRPRH